MDWGFNQHVLKAAAEHGLRYVAPKQMQTSKKAQAKRLLNRDQDYYRTDRKLYLGNDEWLPTTAVYIRNEDSKRTDYRQYVVFMTNAPAGAVKEYNYRWGSRAATNRSGDFITVTTPDEFRTTILLFCACMFLVSDLLDNRFSRIDVINYRT